MDEEKEDPVEQDIEKWFDEHADGLFRFALLRINDQTIAEDLVQETFLAAIKSKDSFLGKSSVRTWLVGILKNKIADHFRRAGKEKLVSDSPDFDSSIDKQFGPFCWARGFGPRLWKTDPEKNAENKQFLATVKKCLDELPERLRRVFLLREVEGYETREVGEVLNTTTSNIRTIMHRSRVFLRSCLERHWLKESDSTE